MKRYRKIIILLIFIAVNLILTPIVKSEANELSSSKITEKQLDEIILKYGKENLIFENGLILKYGENVDLSKIIKNEEITEFFLKDESILGIQDNNILAKSEGVTFLIGKSNYKYHVFQVYVANEVESISSLTEDKLRETYVVYVDAGHGGKDPGAVANGLQEKDLNLKIALKVRNKLKELGVTVVMNRETDVFINYKDTAAHANSVNPDVFVSIHNNASTSSSIHGIESFYTKPIDIPYGKEIHNRLINYTGAYNRGFKEDTYYVTNHTTMPAILVEGGFLTNKGDANKLKTDNYQEKISNAIVDGIMEYLKSNIELKPDITEEPENPDNSDGNEGTDNPDDSEDSKDDNNVENPDEPSDSNTPNIPSEMLNGWIFENNNWYYYKSGEKVKGWLNDNGIWYYLDNSGVMAKGWLNINGTWYYLYNSGAMATGWVQYEGKWYYLHDSGAMAKGWIKTGGKWYYLYSSGAMATGWVKTGGIWYYLYNSGAMATDVVIDGWYINKSGVANPL